MTMLRIPSLAALAFLALLAPVASAGITYSVIDLGTLGGAGSHAWAINDLGQVVGEAQISTGQWHAFIWDAKGGMRDLDSKGYYASSTAHDINSSGEVVGTATAADSTTHAFIWNSDANVMQALSPTYYKSEAWGINSSGNVAGFGRQTSIALRSGLLWSGEGAPVNCGSELICDVNDSGWSVGESPAGHAALWVDGNMRELAASTAQARRISDSGTVVGATLFVSGTNPSHAFVWSAAGGLRVIYSKASLTGAANSVNDLGQVVGAEEEGAASYPWHGFLWDASAGFRRLDNLLGTDPNGWTICDGVDINNSGDIVGDGYQLGSSGDFNSLHAILLTQNLSFYQQPEPCTMVLVIVGLTWLAGRRPRRRQA
jgi:probable HAF family extracellular repeat protein